MKDQEEKLCSICKERDADARDGFCTVCWLRMERRKEPLVSGYREEEWPIGDIWA